MEEKRPRVVGPAPPPAPLDERPPVDADEDESSDDDDDFGPALPAGPSEQTETQESNHRHDEEAAAREKAETKSGRDEWMMMPPKQDDLAARMDPSKLRARGFNTGKGARPAAGSGGDNGIWTETPEQKRKRLEDEVMGRRGVQEAATERVPAQAVSKKDHETAAKVREHAAATRGPSLYDRHQKSADKEEEDDPSQRAFDREKDVAGTKIGSAQRRQMMSKAADFSSKFAGGSFL